MTTVSFMARGSAARTGLAAALTIGGLALSLAACNSSGGADPFAQSLAITQDDYRTNHPITIQDQISTIDIPVSVDSQRLPTDQRANVAYFAQAFLRSGTAVIAVVAPSGSPNQVAAAGIAVQVEDVLRKSGIDPHSIDYRVYRASKDERVAPVRVAFNRIGATTAPCGPWPDDMTATKYNRHFANYGCATQQNLAALVENPLDLLYPRGMTPADAARRADVLQKYRGGERFAGDTSAETGGSIASVGGN